MATRKHSMTSASVDCQPSVQRPGTSLGKNPTGFVILAETIRTHTGKPGRNEVALWVISAELSRFWLSPDFREAWSFPTYRTAQQAVGLVQSLVSDLRLRVVAASSVVDTEVESTDGAPPQGRRGCPRRIRRLHAKAVLKKA